MRNSSKSACAMAVAIILAMSHAHAIPPPPVADFEASLTNGVAPFEVTFTDLSSGVIINRFWDFGDNDTTNTLATTLDHIYDIAGTYTVQLTVTGPSGVSTLTQTDLITVIPEPSTLVLVGIGLLGATVMRRRS